MLKNAPIVILDEATANVDPENEDRLQAAIHALTKDKTIIMIAHRLKNVRDADQILVIDQGRIAVLSQAGRKPGTGNCKSIAYEKEPYLWDTAPFFASGNRISGGSAFLAE